MRAGDRGLQLLAALLAVLLVPALLFTAVRLRAFDPGFYERRFEVLNIAGTTGVPQDDLQRAMALLLDYIRGEADSLELAVTQRGERRQAFDERERLHMVDVRILYERFQRLCTLVLLLAVAVLILALRRREAGLAAARGAAVGFVLVLAVLAALALWAFADFNSFWDAFHLLLFRNDLWLLDPRVSLMINMLPLQLFYSLVVRVLLTGLALLTLPVGAVFFTLRHCKRQKNLVQLAQEIK